MSKFKVGKKYYIKMSPKYHYECKWTDGICAILSPINRDSENLDPLWSNKWDFKYWAEHVEPITVEAWVNVYPSDYRVNGTNFSRPYPTKEIAKSAAMIRLIDTIKITHTYIPKKEG